MSSATEPQSPESHAPPGEISGKALNIALQTCVCPHPAVGAHRDFIRVPDGADTSRIWWTERQETPCRGNRGPVRRAMGRSFFVTM
ncbi:MAG: hypothetical protein R3C51_15280 [Parvularculaceae bacterium]